MIAGELRLDNDFRSRRVSFRAATQPSGRLVGLAG
jgi:hypothetical protein